MSILHKIAEKKLRESENNLKERVIEFNCLYGISKVIETQEMSILEIFQAIIDLIPSAFRFPESACVKIDYDNNMCQTEDFQETEWCTSHNLIINDKNFLISVYYLENLSFMEQEMHLLGEIANRLKMVITKKIAEQKLRESEERLRESEERYRLISENSKEVVFTMNMNLRHTYLTPSIYDLLGYTVEETLNMTFENYTAPSSVKILKEAFIEELKVEKKKKDTNRVRKFEIEQMHKDGSIVNVELSLTFLRDNNGKAIALLGIARNITERKRAEHKIEESEGRMRDLLDTAPIGVLELNLKTMDIEYINPKLLNIVGFDLDELNKKEIILSNFDISNNKNLEFKFYDKQKNLIWLSGAKGYQHDDFGFLESVRIWVQDITDKKKLEQKLKDISAKATL